MYGNFIDIVVIGLGGLGVVGNIFMALGGLRKGLEC